MKLYTIIGGVNGVGKSSLSGVLSSENRDLGIIIDTDKLTLQLGGDRIKGGKAAISMINDCLQRGINFTQETTLSGFRTLRTIKQARELDYTVRLYYIGVGSYEESISRIQNRVCKGGHDIPAADVERRYEKRFDDLAKVLPYCNEVIFFDNENGFTEVGYYRNGAVVITADSPPKWIVELKYLLTDYTEWQRLHYDDISEDKLQKNIEKFIKENPSPFHK